MEVSPSQISDFMRFLNHGNWVFQLEKRDFHGIFNGIFSIKRGFSMWFFSIKKIWIKLIKVLHGIWVPLHRHPAGCTMRVSASRRLPMLRLHLRRGFKSIRMHTLRIWIYICIYNVYIYIYIYIYILCISYIDSAWYHTTIYHKSIVYSVYRNHLVMIHLSYILYSQKTVAMLSYINKIAMFKTLYQSCSTDWLIGIPMNDEKPEDVG